MLIKMEQLTAHQKELIEPRDATVIKSILKDLGINNYEPGVVALVLDFCHRYVAGVLDDARTFSDHAGRKIIRTDDIKLSVMMQLDKVFASPPPRDIMLDVARTKNGIPLPLVLESCSIRLPPDEYCSIPPRIDDLL